MRIKFILYPALHLLARWRQPRLAARILAMCVRPLPAQPKARKGRAEFRVLALNLNKPGFLEDIEASLLADDAFEVVCWPNYVLKACASAILAPQLNNKRYASDDQKIESSKREYCEFLLAMWRRFRSLQRIDAVVSANFGYFAQREFGAALQEYGTPLIVLHKENVKSPERVEYWRPIYRTRGRFEGSKILVYNETERDLQADTGVADREQIDVTGMPRLDRIHRWRRAHAGKRNGPVQQVLFFSFWRKEKLTATERVTEARTRIDDAGGEWAGLTWTDLCKGTHAAIVELARQRPQTRVVVKTKGYSRRVKDILDILGGSGQELPPNLSIVSGGDPFPLLTDSDVVIGFNTTALLEALAAGKPVIVPQFAEANDPRMRTLVIDVGQAVQRATSPEELVRIAGEHLDASSPLPAELPDAAMQALTYWVGNDDGCAGQRVCDAVRSEIRRLRRDVSVVTVK